MGTETKFNCYTENHTSNGGGIIPKAFNGSSSAAGAAGAGIVGFGAAQKSHTNGVSTLNGLANGKQNGATNGTTVIACPTAAVNASSPPFIPIKIDEHHVIEGAKQILKVIRPHWNLSAVEFKTFTDGITNKLVGCFYKPTDTANGKTNGTTNGNSTNGHRSTNGNSELSHSYDENNDSGNISDAETNDSETSTSADVAAAASTDNVVLVRVYGNKTDLLIDRNAEKRNILLLHSYGFAPSLYATFKNGLAYDYVPGITLNTSNVLEPEVWRLVARRMAEMHRTVKVRTAGDMAGTPVPMLWKKTQKFLDLVPERFSDAEKHKRIEGTFLPITRMRDEFTALYRRLEALGSPVVFAHNDLLLGNIVYLESQQSVNFIDYEYAEYNFQAFDIGNHFCEFAGVDEVDYSRYPQREFQLQWLRVYLQAYLQRAHVTDADVERLYVQVNQFALAAHFFWIIWSLIQAEHSNIDFDYVDYGLVRYKEYLKRKDEFLALDINGGNNSNRS